MTTISAIAIVQAFAFIAVLLVVLKQHISADQDNGFKVFRTLMLGMVFEIFTSVFTQSAAVGTPDQWMPAFGFAFGFAFLGLIVLNEVETAKKVPVVA